MYSKGFAAVRGALVAGLALIVVGCTGVARYDAAGDVHNFLIAIRNGDTQTFNAYVDRPALKEQLRAHVLAAAAQRGGAMGAVGALLARPVVGVDPEPSRHRGRSAETGHRPCLRADQGERALPDGVPQ
jgi:hypothetical protein